MLNWALVYFAVAAVAGIFGFLGIDTVSTDVAQIICVLFGALGLIALAAGGMRRGGQQQRQGRRRERE